MAEPEEPTTLRLCDYSLSESCGDGDTSLIQDTPDATIEEIMPEDESTLLQNARESHPQAVFC